MGLTVACVASVSVWGFVRVGERLERVGILGRRMGREQKASGGGMWNGKEAGKSSFAPPPPSISHKTPETETLLCKDPMIGKPLPRRCYFFVSPCPTQPPSPIKTL